MHTFVTVLGNAYVCDTFELEDHNFILLIIMRSQGITGTSFST